MIACLARNVYARSRAEPRIGGIDPRHAFGDALRSKRRHRASSVHRADGVGEGPVAAEGKHVDRLV